MSTTPFVKPPFTGEQIENYLQRRYERGLREMRQAESVIQDFVRLGYPAEYEALN